MFLDFVQEGFFSDVLMVWVSYLNTTELFMYQRIFSFIICFIFCSGCNEQIKNHELVDFNSVSSLDLAAKFQNCSEESAKIRLLSQSLDSCSLRKDQKKLSQVDL